MDPKQVEELVKQNNLTAPRVSLADIEANIAHTEIVKHITPSGSILRWAVLTTRCGFSATGRPSASVSVENDNAQIGEEVAIENARAELWVLMGYALKERLYLQDKPLPQSDLPPHQQRMIGEFADLAARLDKLNNFLSGSKANDLPADELNRLRAQRDAMEAYRAALSARIDVFYGGVV